MKRRLTEREQRLSEACRWHQQNDRNGDFMEMWAEYKRSEIELSTVHEVCERVFVEIRDEHLDPDDRAGVVYYNDWIEYIGEEYAE
jgi:hypothetical protein